MCVLVEYAAESMTSMDVQQVESVGSGERFKNWPQGRRAAQGTVRPMRSL
jgi:hypothetical protein